MYVVVVIRIKQKGWEKKEKKSLRELKEFISPPQRVIL